MEAKSTSSDRHGIIAAETSSRVGMLPEALGSGDQLGGTRTRNGPTALSGDDTLPTPRPGEVVLGRLSAFDEEGIALVDFPLNGTGKPLRARMTTRLSEGDVGRELALLFEQGDPRKPIVVGAIWRADGAAEETAGHDDAMTHPSVRDERHHVTISADTAIVLRCGEASITLTRAGKIILRGKYVLSRSTGVNRIKGGAVQIN